MASLSSRQTMPGGNSFVVGQFPQALGILTVSVERGIKARPTWLPQQQAVTGRSLLLWCRGHLGLGLGGSIRQRYHIPAANLGVPMEKALHRKPTTKSVN